MTIKEIARIANVSIATVSRVVNHSGYVKKETREKIEKIIEENNYIPNAIARSLSTQESYNIGVIVADIGNEFFTSVIRGITDVAEKENLNIVLFNTDENEEKEHMYLKIAESERFKGILISPVSAYDKETRNRILRLDQSGVPIVLVDRSVEELDMDGVFVENYKNAYRGVEQLIKEGHKKIGIITGPENSFPAMERLRGYVDALKDHQIEIRKEYIATGNFKVDRAYSCTEKLLNLKDRPTAIFTINNKTSIGCLKYITEKKLVLGRDVAVLGFDGIYSLKAIAYPFSAIERDERKQGREAMKLLINKIDSARECGNQKRRTRKIMIPCQINLRGSEKYMK